MTSVAVQNQKDNENPLVHLCDCSGNSPGYFLSLKCGNVSSVGAPRLCDCSWWYSKPCVSWTSAAGGSMLLGFSETLFFPCPLYPCQKEKKKQKNKGKVCSLILMIHYTSGLWNGCVWLLELKFDFDEQFLYELELFTKNIQWLILIWGKLTAF